MDIPLRSHTTHDVPTMAMLHAEAFARGWSEAEFHDMLRIPGTHALVAGGERFAGFVLYRLAADECEVLTVVVASEHRRQSVATWLMGQVIESISAHGIKTIFLEVADDNEAAQALYRSLGFSVSGRRKGYYTQGRDRAVDAVLMRLELSASAGSRL